MLFITLFHREVERWDFFKSDQSSLENLDKQGILKIFLNRDEIETERKATNVMIFFLLVYYNSYSFNALF